MVCLSVRLMYSEDALARIDYLFNTVYPTDDYPGNPKQQKAKRMEAIAEAFYNDHGCKCAISKEECREVVERYHDVYSKDKYQLPALAQYITTQYGVPKPIGSMDELRRVAMVGPSV